MKFTVTSSPAHKVAADALFVAFDEKGAFASPEHADIRKHLGYYAEAIAKKTVTREWFCTLDSTSDAATKHLLLDSATFGHYMPGDEMLKSAGARAAGMMRDYSQKRLAVIVDRRGAAELACAIAEGLWMGDFKDQRFKSKPSDREEMEVQIVVPKDQRADVKKAIDELVPVLEGVSIARELVNAPNNELTPAALTGAGVKVAEQFGLDFELLDDKELEEEGYLLLWNVGRGSEHKPRMLTLSYAPKRVKIREHIMLVGKGMTFDTGGYCIKAAANMFKMNNDMGGAAAVIGAMHAIAALKLPVRVTAIVPSAHNAIDAAAYHPGAIIKSKNGKTVFIGNTDAEGRLILADAFARAAMEKPDVMIDLATLTGSICVALGTRIAGLFSDDKKLVSTIHAAGDATGDSVWPMPLWKEYEHDLVHALADLNNITKPGADGGSIHGANFLKAFVPEGVRWAHVDIAPVAVTEAKARCCTPGGTGFGVRLIVDMLRRMLK